MMKLHRVPLVLTLLFTLLTVGCDRQDDVEIIFTGKEWHLAGFYQTHDWDNSNAGTSINDYNSHSDISAYNVTFYADGMARVVLPQGCVLTGHWDADGKERTFCISEWKVVEGDPKELTGYGKQMYDNMLKVAFYQGDSNYIRLFDETRRYFMQFGDRSKFKN